MSRLNKFLSFGLCIMVIGGILSFKGNRVFADTRLLEIASETPEKPTIGIEFECKSDVISLAMALRDVIGVLSKHSSNVLCPYDLLRMMFVSTFERETLPVFRGNDDAIIKKICGVFTDIILKDSLEKTLNNKAKYVCGSMRVICLDYKEASKTAEEQIANVVGVALTGSLSEIRAVYYKDFGYRLVAGGRKLAI